MGGLHGSYYLEGKAETKGWAPPGTTLALSLLLQERHSEDAHKSANYKPGPTLRKLRSRGS